jgi:recombination associated protein RdgC
MWFKNLSLFRFSEPFTLSSAEVAEKLETMRFRPCGGHDEFSFGWTAPLGQGYENLVHSSNGFILVCGKKQEKVLPAAVVNELLQEKILDLETQQARKLSRKERAAIKDELLFELLPQAFSFSRHTYAYIDPQGGWVVVDSATGKKAEDLLSYLRRCLGSLPIVPMNTLQNPIAVMTEWLIHHQTPSGISIENECELRSADEEGGIVRCKKHDLSLPEIKNHLETGKQVIKLALNWEDRLAFVLDENLSVKRLRFLELIQNQATEINTESEQERFDVDFSIMTAEFSHFLPKLLELFGGENKT